jgi:hypothetical protein
MDKKYLFVMMLVMVLVMGMFFFMGAGNSRSRYEFHAVKYGNFSLFFVFDTHTGQFMRFGDPQKYGTDIKSSKEFEAYFK